MCQGFAELRDGIFPKVAQRAIRRIALMAFRHLHRLSLRFHLDRQTGGLTRAIERGAKGIEFLLTRSEEHTSELQSLMRISYAVFCLKKKKKTSNTNYKSHTMHNNRQNKHKRSQMKT